MTPVVPLNSTVGCASRLLLFACKPQRRRRRRVVEPNVSGRLSDEEGDGCTCCISKPNLWACFHAHDTWYSAGHSLHWITAPSSRSQSVQFYTRQSVSGDEVSMCTSNSNHRRRRAAREVGTHVLPPVLRDRADALDQAEARRVREGDLRDEDRAEHMHPRLALRRLARAQVRVGRRVDELLLRVAPHPGTQKTVGDLQKPKRKRRCQSVRQHLGIDGS